MGNIESIFGSMVFSDTVMRSLLPHDTYEKLQKTIQEGRDLDRSVADVVANAMKDWAISKGATHFTHWFQPLTDVTAEKHDAFLTPTGPCGIVMEFSGKELIKGEPDASSFPSGGLRATFEARGYTAWDPTSYAFIKDNTLCIPTAFYSYTGSVLDKKTPLLRSVEALNRETLRILRLFGHKNVRRVYATVGPEQEYFLIDRAVYERRPDLKYTGRTLFGARPAKGQEMDDQYFGALKTRISAFMRELDEELWKLGVFARTEHNEAAPAQHELAPVFTNVNVATDHNQLTMEMMKKVAVKHGLVCLLHEKPFAGVNGSGKHNNWSLSTDTGVNLFEPGKSPAENMQFLLFLAAMMHAVDEHQDLLRISAASAGNDHRLGASEAPPAIVSMFLGDELTAVVEAITHKEIYQAEKPYLEMGLPSLPRIRRDTTDRNRTSPFAFTGNKFEFRMVGSSFSIADANTVLNTAVADALRDFADELELADDFTLRLGKLIRREFRAHKRILFNGNNYAPEWVEEAEKRGLCNYRSSVDAIGHLTDAKNVELFARHGVFTGEELASRREIMFENYAKIVHIEALTMLDMVRRAILPTMVTYTDRLAQAALRKRELGVAGEYETKLAAKLSALTDRIAVAADSLEDAAARAQACSGNDAKARCHREAVIPAMQELRAACDEAELLVARDVWPYPSYGEMLYSVM